MPIEIQDLMQEVRDRFSKLYQSKRPASTTNTALAFEPLGQPVSGADFKLRPEDVDYSQPLAIERLSDIVDDVPTLSEGVFIDTGRNVDDFYFMLIMGANSNPDADTWPLFSTLKNEALKRWAQHSRASLIDPQIQYRASLATPTDWYRSDVEANWTKSEFSVNQPSPAPSGSPAPPTRLNPSVALWKFAPPAPAFRGVMLANPALRLRMTEAHAMVQPTVRPEVAPTPVAALRPMAVQPMLIHRTDLLEPAAVAVAAAPEASLTEINPRVNLKARLAVQREIAASAPTNPVQSPNFTISFKYCMVEIERPWLFEPFLQDRSWRVPGYNPGAFSNGNAENSTGLLPAIPVAFIVIKELAISANWSSEDAKAIENGIGFGPFSLVGRTFTSNTLSCPGVQIIGWICQLMPTLAPT